MQPAKEIRVPDNQLHLTDVELEEEIAKMLTANNPEAPKALVRFIQKERAYKPEAMIVQTMKHYSTDGWLLHQESEDARKQTEQHRNEEELQKKFLNEMHKNGHEAGVHHEHCSLSRKANLWQVTWVARTHWNVYARAVGPDDVWRVEGLRIWHAHSISLQSARDQYYIAVLDSHQLFQFVSLTWLVLQTTLWTTRRSCATNSTSASALHRRPHCNQRTRAR